MQINDNDDEGAWVVGNNLLMYFEGLPVNTSIKDIINNRIKIRKASVLKIKLRWLMIMRD